MDNAIRKDVYRRFNESGLLSKQYLQILSNKTNGESKLLDNSEYHLNMNGTQFGGALETEDLHLTYLRNSHKYSTFVEDNFFYQHIFNLSLVVIFLLQVLLVWVFLVRRKAQNDQNQIDLNNLPLDNNLNNIAIVIHPGNNNLLSRPAPPG